LHIHSCFGHYYFCYHVYPPYRFITFSIPALICSSLGTAAFSNSGL
jgi:hypothetical protein